ncbi:hypothetical protein BDM02DRAFT_1775157 [Thelephora ganbajun]|uniref:Uncharacterized protein n=1 Tax=Thelephora ganbajun TaxID=370292 RepID=A0ACB6Z132_THEGA|nr:hypothetical protein BDM02DRAFT_1775157 [Thelephora ganbajun]
MCHTVIGALAEGKRRPTLISLCFINLHQFVSFHLNGLLAGHQRSSRPLFHRLPSGRSNCLVRRLPSSRVRPCGHLSPRTVIISLRKVGLTARMNRGVPTPDVPHKICEQGKKHTPEQSQLVKLLGCKTVEFEIKLLGRWEKEAGDVMMEPTTENESQTNDSDGESEGDGEDTSDLSRPRVRTAEDSVHRRTKQPLDTRSPISPQADRICSCHQYSGLKATNGKRPRMGVKTSVTSSRRSTRARNLLPVVATFRFFSAGIKPIYL